MTNMQEVIMTVGLPASGKSTKIKEYLSKENPYIWLNRDTEGGKVISLLPKMKKELNSGNSIVLDCTFVSKKAREPFVEECNKMKVPIKCIWMTTSAEDCQINALNRMWDRYGTLFLDPDSLRGVKDPNMFPISAIFGMKKEFEKPEISEGFSDIVKVKFTRVWDKKFENKAIFLDYDGTLRETKGGNGLFPVRPSEVVVRKNAGQVLSKYIKDGYRLVGVSNQSGIGKGDLTAEDAEECFNETNKQIGINIEYCYCPHRIPPAKCYCRKPQSGMAIYFIRKYNLNPNECLMIGDMTSDETFANRMGIKFIHADKFFGE